MTGTRQTHGVGDAPQNLHDVGTVAEEAARLVDLLSTYRRTDGQAEPGQGPNGSGSPGDGPRPESGCTCGQPAACRVCPVCQLIAFVQQVSPDTIDRLADAVELAATGLRDLAVTQRRRRTEDGPGPG